MSKKSKPLNPVFRFEDVPFVDLRPDTILRSDSGQYFIGHMGTDGKVENARKVTLKEAVQFYAERWPCSSTTYDTWSDLLHDVLKRL